MAANDPSNPFGPGVTPIDTAVRHQGGGLNPPADTDSRLRGGPAPLDPPALVDPSKIDVAGGTAEDFAKLKGLMTTANAATRNVTGDELSRNQLNIMLDKGSPLMTRAESRAMDRMSARGIINSTMAGTAGQAAVIDTAQPFALSDADAYRRAASENLANQQQSNIANAQMQNAQLAQTYQSRAQERQAAVEAQLRDIENQRQSALRRGELEVAAGLEQDAIRLRQEGDREITGLNNAAADARQRAELEASAARQGVDINAAAERQRTEIEANRTLEELRQSYGLESQRSEAGRAVFLNSQTAINNILTDPNIPADAKTGLIDNVVKQAKAAYQAIRVSSGPDFDDLYPPSNSYAGTGNVPNDQVRGNPPGGRVDGNTGSPGAPKPSFTSPPPVDYGGTGGGN